MAPRQLPGLGLYGYWGLGYEPWNVEHDPDTRMLSVLVQCRVLSRTTALPGVPVNGDIYIVPSGGDANKIAVRDDGAWVYFIPTEGLMAYVLDDNEYVMYDGAAWVPLSAASAVDSVFGRTGAVIAAAGDYDAVEITFDPTGLTNTTATDVQEAIADLDAAIGGVGSGDVVGPGSSTADSFARFDGTTGKLLKDGFSRATDAQVRAATADKIITTELIESASAFVALTDGANIAVDWDAAVNFSLTIGGNRTLDNPTNGQPGTWRTVVITQDGTGTRTLAYGNQYKFPGGTEPVLTTAAGSIDVLNIQCITSTSFHVFFANDMKV